MEYKQLSSVLKRFSFEEKMRVAQIHSRKTFTASGTVSPDVLREIATPWELETFVHFAVKAIEWKNDVFQGKNNKTFEQIINCIRDAEPELLKTIDGEDFITWLFLASASVQFEAQEFYPYKLFRFNYYFAYCNEKINMQQCFKEKFGCSYYEYSLLGYVLWMLFSMDDFTQKAFTALVNIFPTPISHLILTRQEYIDALDKITTDPNHYMYCLRPSYSYPFIDHNGTAYCPLPHLLKRATSSSLMHRLTDGNSGLKTLIGKEVYEAYLFTIINESNIFDEVIAEKIYYIHGTERKTADIMTRCDDNYIFFDSKSFTPKIAIRDFSQEALNKDVIRLAEACVQMYNHIRKRFIDEYCYFETTPQIKKDNIFGLVIIQENPCIMGKLIYKKAAEILKISEESDEYTWLYTHVGISTIYDVERYCFTGTNMVPQLQKLSREKTIIHEWLSGEINNKTTYKRYREFLGIIKEDMIQTLQML